MKTAELILHNASIATLDPQLPEVSAVAIADGRILETGDERTDWGVWRAYHHSNAAAGGSASHSSSCSNPLHQHTHTVVGEHGSWGIGCTCFAY